MLTTLLRITAILIGTNVYSTNQAFMEEDSIVEYLKKRGALIVRDQDNSGGPATSVSIGDPRGPTIKSMDELAFKLGSLKGLKYIYFFNTDLSNAGLNEISKLSRVEVLWIHGAPITDLGLKEIGKLKELQELKLEFTDLDGKGLKELSGLRELKKLNLTGSRLFPKPGTNAGIEALKSLPKLRVLVLKEVKLTDAALLSISKLKHLHTLDLTHTKITDKGLKELGSLSELRHLFVDFTGVTANGAMELKKLLPECKIHGTFDK